MRRPVPLFTAVLAVLAVLAGLALAAPVSVASAATPSSARAKTAAPPYALGAFACCDSGSSTGVQQFESVLGSRVAIASSFRGWGDIFPSWGEVADSDSGHTLLVAWDLGDTADTRFTTFTSGAHDGYLSAEASAAAAYGKPLYLRPWAEMNGDWTAFQPTADGSRPAGGTPAQFIAAWRYLVTFFRTHGATNVRWVFNPTTDTYPATTPVSAIWPGSAYVDVLGLDGYNWGTGGWFTWRSFSDIYTTQYRNLVALDPAAPVWVCEFASKEPTEDDGAPVDPQHSKATWYRDMLSWMSTVGTNVRALVMFDIRKERDWRLASDPAAVRVMRPIAAAAPKSVAATPPVVVTATVTVRVRAVHISVVTVRARVLARGRVHVASARARASAAAVAVATVTSTARSLSAARTSARSAAQRQANAKARAAARARAQRLARVAALAKARRVVLTRLGH
jgi:hypothetical protein